MSQLLTNQLATESQQLANQDITFKKKTQEMDLPKGDITYICTEKPITVSMI